MVETINGGNNSRNSKNTKLDRRPIHIYGGMKHNLVGYAEYYSCGCTEISRSSEFTREIDYSRKVFSRH
jgi:hypothetical protein